MIGEYGKGILLGIIQGVTEWLPISSTAHMLIFNRLCPLAVPPGFFALFTSVIQLASALAVLCLYAGRLFPPRSQRREGRRLWGRLLISCLPLVLIGLPADRLLERLFYSSAGVTRAGFVVICITLIFYGLLFVVWEAFWHRPARYSDGKELSLTGAFGVGCAQILAVLPGTSRSGATVLGGRLAGLGRPEAAEYSFLLALPVMLGAGGLQTVKAVLAPSFAFTWELGGILAVGCLTAFGMSLLTVRGLVRFVRSHSFLPFGLYRIALGLLLALFFT